MPFKCSAICDLIVPYCSPITGPPNNLASSPCSSIARSIPALSAGYEARKNKSGLLAFTARTIGL
jgi:hypothetical protein